MRVRRVAVRAGLVLSISALSLLGACAKKPETSAKLTAYRASGETSSVSQAPAQLAAAVMVTPPSAIPATDNKALVTGSIRPSLNLGGGEGRTIEVASAADLLLRPGEVVLTFDDGPSPKVTPLILSALADADVKATFFMVGQMATAHPQTALAVARAGHTVGTHTDNHAKLTVLSEANAMKRVNQGFGALKKVLEPEGFQPAPFFRFPYLAQTKVLRSDVRERGFVIFGADVDSKDYRSETPTTILDRTLAKLESRGGGIVLFHDIHMRTARMLPDFLKALKDRGFHVVDAVPANPRPQLMPAQIASR